MNKFKSVLFLVGFCLVVVFGYGLSPVNAALKKPKEVQHPPFADKECESCHSSDNPSGKDLSSEAPKMCYECHDEFSGKFLHSPSSLGECLICHNPHESDNEFLLNEPLPDLCYLCHDLMEKKMNDELNTTHSPAADSCTNCHNPHGSDVNQKFLKKEPKKLCTECHAEEDVTLPVDITAVKHKHQPLESEKTCLNCHDPHASPFDNHLLAEPMDLCFKCHNKEVTAYDGATLMSIKGLIDSSKDVHGPIKEKNCSGCHSPHGSDYYRILLNYYPKEFYTDTFSEDNYKLCFSCHERTLLRDKETTTLTNFRDGNRNLHYLHVNRVGKGRTCRACHETHASNHFKHIRDAVPFGKIKWQLQLKYQAHYSDKKTGKPCDTPSETCVKTGGSCVACHDRKIYNNSKK